MNYSLIDYVLLQHETNEPCGCDFCTNHSERLVILRGSGTALTSVMLNTDLPYVVRHMTLHEALEYSKQYQEVVE